MAFLICTPGRDSRKLFAAIRRLAPEIDLRLWPDVGDATSTRFVLAWKPPAGLFAELPGLVAVSSLGAGVDGLVDRPDLPPDVTVGRLAGPRLAADLAAYLVAVTVDHWKRLDTYRDDQQARRWQPRLPPPAPTVGLLGTGVMGRKAAAAFAALDLQVIGWNRCGGAVDGLEVQPGADGLMQVAARADVLINLLPLTAETRGILGNALFRQMKSDALLINVGRGAHLVEADLLAAVDRDRPGSAVLDVFEHEPLPETHPFWHHPRIRITPHCGGLTSPEEAARMAVESYRRVMQGYPPLGAVDRRRGY